VTRWDTAIAEPLRAVLADAQTSGGLLVSTPDARALLAALERAGVGGASQIGEVVAADPAGTIEVVP
jgi:hypothetical protein